MDYLTKRLKLQIISSHGVREGIKKILSLMGLTLEGLAVKWGKAELSSLPITLSRILGGHHPKHWARFKLAEEIGLTWDEIEKAASRDKAA